jgi:hypothetical protein
MRSEQMSSRSKICGLADFDRDLVLAKVTLS